MDGQKPIEVLTYRTGGDVSRQQILWAALSIAAVLLAFPVGVMVTILMESRSGLFNHPASERGGFAVFAFGEALGSAAGWIAYTNARAGAPTSPRAKLVRVVALVGALLGVLGAVIALALLFRGAVG
jgi:hypothetical protein